MQFSCCAWKVFNLGHRSMTRGKYLLLRVTALLSGKFYALCSKSSLLLCWFLGSRISLGGMASCPPKSWLMFCTKFIGIEPWLGGMWCGYRKQGYGREWQRFSWKVAWHRLACFGVLHCRGVQVSHFWWLLPWDHVLLQCSRAAYVVTIPNAVLVPVLSLDNLSARAQVWVIARHSI